MSDRPVGDDIDRDLRTVMADLADAADPAPDYELISSPLYVPDNGEVSKMRRTRWIVAGAAAAAVLVLVVVGVAVANTNDDDAAETATEATEVATEVPTTATEVATEVPTTEPETATSAPVSDLELATQFLTDLHSLDTEATLAVMEADAVVSYLAARSTDDIAGLQGVFEARGLEFTLGSCEEVVASGALAGDESITQFECDLTFEDAVSKAAGLGPYPGSVARVMVEDGAVTLATLYLEWNQWAPEVDGPWETWLAENHPDDVRVMYGIEGTNPGVTPESVALWEEYTAEYIAEKYG